MSIIGMLCSLFIPCQNLLFQGEVWKASCPSAYTMMLHVSTPTPALDHPHPYLSFTVKYV